MTVDEQLESVAQTMIEMSWRGGCDKVHVVAGLRALYDRGRNERQTRSYEMTKLEERARELANDITYDDEGRISEYEIPEAMVKLAREHAEKELSNIVKELDEARAEVERVKETMRAIINYWYPKLGYTKANELVYPALKDRRATDAPKLAELDRLKAKYSEPK